MLTFYNRTWPDLAGLGRTWEGGSLQLEHLLESEEDNEIEILPNGEIRAVGGSDPAERGFKKPLTMREDLGGEYGARRRVGRLPRQAPLRQDLYVRSGWVEDGRRRRAYRRIVAEPRIQVGTVLDRLDNPRPSGAGGEPRRPRWGSTTPRPWRV